MARSVRVFGSVARGNPRRDSDIDFLVEFDADRTLFDLIGLRLDLSDLLGADVEVVTPDSLLYIRDKVLAEARTISSWKNRQMGLPASYSGLLRTRR